MVNHVDPLLCRDHLMLWMMKWSVCSGDTQSVHWGEASTHTHVWHSSSIFLSTRACHFTSHGLWLCLPSHSHKHSGTARCNYGCSCHNTWSPTSPLTVGHEGGRRRRSNCWHRLWLCTMSVIRLGGDRWPTQAPQLALTNTHILKQTRS